MVIWEAGLDCLMEKYYFESRTAQKYVLKKLETNWLTHNQIGDTPMIYQECV